MNIKKPFGDNSSFNIKMPKSVWYHEDSEDPTFTVITYDMPRKVAKRHERSLARAKARAEEIDAMCRDPLVKFEFEKYTHERQELRRYRRDPKYANLKNNDILSIVRAYYSPEYPPVILGGKSNQDVPEKSPRSKINFNRRAPGASSLRKIEQRAEEGITNVRYFTRDFVTAVSQRRQELEWTQRDLALRINVPESTISALERGELQFDGELKGKLTVELEL